MFFSTPSFLTIISLLFKINESLTLNTINREELKKDLNSFGKLSPSRTSSLQKWYLNRLERHNRLDKNKLNDFYRLETNATLDEPKSPSDDYVSDSKFLCTPDQLNKIYKSFNYIFL